MHHRLKMFLGETPAETVAPSTITVTLREVLGTLTEAVNTRKAWVQDFADDQIQIPNDLYDVLVAYSRLGKSA